MGDPTPTQLTMLLLTVVLFVRFLTNSEPLKCSSSEVQLRNALSFAYAAWLTESTLNGVK